MSTSMLRQRRMIELKVQIGLFKIIKESMQSYAIQFWRHFVVHSLQEILSRTYKNAHFSKRSQLFASVFWKYLFN